MLWGKETVGKESRENLKDLKAHSDSSEQAASVSEWA